MGPSSGRPQRSLLLLRPSQVIGHPLAIAAAVAGRRRAGGLQDRLHVESRDAILTKSLDGGSPAGTREREGFMVTAPQYGANRLAPHPSDRHDEMPAILKGSDAGETGPTRPCGSQGRPPPRCRSGLARSNTLGRTRRVRDRARYPAQGRAAPGHAVRGDASPANRGTSPRLHPAAAGPLWPRMGRRWLWQLDPSPASSAGRTGSGASGARPDTPRATRPTLLEPGDGLVERAWASGRSPGTSAGAGLPLRAGDEFTGSWAHSCRAREPGAHGRPTDIGVGIGTVEWEGRSARSRRRWRPSRWASPTDMAGAFSIRTRPEADIRLSHRR